MTIKDRIAIFLLLVILVISVISMTMNRFPQLAQTAPIAPACTPAPTATPTPWIQQEILVEMTTGKGITVWVNNPEQARIKIGNAKNIGVIDTAIMDKGHSIYIRIDPRYNKTVAAREIIKLLTSSHQTGPK